MARHSLRKPWSRFANRAQCGLLSTSLCPAPSSVSSSAPSAEASACLDVSDGLVADARHLAEESGLDLEIAAAEVPLSEATRVLVEARPDLLTRVLTGGDDYELLFGVPPGRQAEVERLAERLGLPLTRIGKAVPTAGGGSVRLYDGAGRPLTVERGGWTHF